MSLSLILSLTALSQKDGSGCWRRGTTTIAFQKNAEWNLHCFMGHRHAQNQPNCAITHKQTNERWNTKQLLTNRTLLCPVLKAPLPLHFWAKHQTFMILPMRVETFYSFTEFVSWIIVLFKQNGALKTQHFGEKNSMSFTQQEKHMELTEIGANWMICPKKKKKKAIAQLKGIFSVWERGNNCHGKQSATAE